MLFTVGSWRFAACLGWVLLAVYVADTYVRAAVNGFRFWTGERTRVARESGIGAGTGAS
ncbi:hypothetical protein [Halorussus halobius]|uniref:hypothetical protein n=1 Tax=Halorussus halobius TaxID=1710537 RepID=UPI00143D6EAA|nr:hypothetical protein [Halorussus halobius]